MQAFASLACGCVTVPTCVIHPRRPRAPKAALGSLTAGSLAADFLAAGLAGIPDRDDELEPELGANVDTNSSAAATSSCFMSFNGIIHLITLRFSSLSKRSGKVGGKAVGLHAVLTTQSETGTSRWGEWQRTRSSEPGGGCGPRSE